jgi:hypothetical protein
VQSFEVVARSGSQEKRLLGVRISPSDFYFTFHYGGNNHYSYHKDGTIWITRDGRRKKISENLPLDKFKDFCGITSVAFERIDFKNTTPTRKRTKVVLDVGSIFERGMNLGISVHLVETDRNDLVDELTGKTKSVSHNLIKSANPWILITASESNTLTGAPLVVNVSKEDAENHVEVRIIGRLIKSKDSKKVLDMHITKVKKEAT